MKPLDQCRLYTFVDTAYLHGCPAAEVARQLCDGGSDLIQLRAKDRSPEEVRRLAEEIQPIVRSANVGLVINDHWDIAREIGADFCHLGQEDFFDAGRNHISQLATLHRRPLAGLSTHAPDQAARALAAGPAYIAIGPVFATGTKPQARPVTLEYVRWAAAHVQIPWFAIGGINLNNLDEVLAAGAERICVVSAILNAPDIARACKEFRMRLSNLNAVNTRDESYTLHEMAMLASTALPTRGPLCPKCGARIPQFADLTEKDEVRLRKMIREDRKIMATLELRNRVHCPLAWAKIWVLHGGRPDGIGTTAPCPYCGKPLATALAKQCPHCNMDWHDPNKPKRLGSNK